MTQAGFTKVKSGMLPRVDIFMVNDFLMQDKRLKHPKLEVQKLQCK